MSEVNEIRGLTVNYPIVNAIIQSVESCFQMCDTKVHTVGITKIPTQLPNAGVTGMIGMSGKCTGFMTLNLPERVALLAVSGLLQDEFTKLNLQVIDGVGELTNIIAGGLKTKMYNTPWMVANITIPSVILGTNYQISYTKGIEYCSVSFEVEDTETLSVQDRVFMVNTSLLKV
jgi:chemotaxis protein CheX